MRLHSTMCTVYTHTQRMLIHGIFLHPLECQMMIINVKFDGVRDFIRIDNNTILMRHPCTLFVASNVHILIALIFNQIQRCSTHDECYTARKKMQWSSHSNFGSSFPDRPSKLTRKWNKFIKIDWKTRSETSMKTIDRPQPIQLAQLFD